jgi:hypothetical protein
MAERALRRIEKALTSAARQLQAASALMGSLNGSLASAASARATKVRSENGVGRKGGRRGALLDARTLRSGIFHFLQSARTPLTTREIMDALVDGAHLQFKSAKDKTNFSTRISIAMRRYESQGVIKTVGKAAKGKPIRWALAK